MQTSTFTKLIEMQFERDGKRTKFVGFIGELRDESGIVLHSQSYDTKPAAEQALDALAHELLIDYAERGLVDALPIKLPRDADIAYMSRCSEYNYDVYVEGCWMASAKNQHHADVAAVEAHYRGHLDVVRCPTCGGDGDCPDCTISDELCACGAVATLIVQERSCEAHICGLCFLNDYENNHEDSHAWTVEPLVAIAPPGFPDDDDDSEDGGGPPSKWRCIACQTSEYPPSSRLAETCLECANAWYFGLKNRFAVTRQSQAIEARLTVCGYCQGIHHIQSCPSLRQAVSAELGRGLCQMLWRNHAGFVALISGATPARLVEFAESYLRFLASYSSTNLTVREVLAVWSREIGRGPALQRAA